MRKIRNTDDMLFALYKSWKKHYGMRDSGGSKAVLTVSAQTWESFAVAMHVTFFNGNYVYSMFTADLPSDALKAFDKIQNKAMWSLYDKNSELKGPWSREHTEAFDFIVSFWRERI
jgi:hypothetical protein